MEKEIVEQVDCIVFLAGELERYLFAKNLTKKNLSKILYSPGGEHKGIIRLIQKDLEKEPEIKLIISTKIAKSTFDEAVNSKKFIQSNNYKSLVLVTSDYHKKRADWLFKKMIPQINIISLPIPRKYSWYSESKIKINKLKFMEQLKFIKDYFRCLVF